MSKNYVFFFFSTAAQILYRPQLNITLLFSFGRLSVSYPIYLKAILRCECIGFWSPIWGNRSISLSLDFIDTHFWQIHRNQQSRLSGFSLMITVSLAWFCMGRMSCRHECMHVLMRCETQCTCSWEYIWCRNSEMTTTMCTHDFWEVRWLQFA